MRAHAVLALCIHEQPPGRIEVSGTEVDRKQGVQYALPIVQVETVDAPLCKPRMACFRQRQRGVPEMRFRHSPCHEACQRDEEKAQSEAAGVDEARKPTVAVDCRGTLERILRHAFHRLRAPRVTLPDHDQKSARLVAEDLEMYLPYSW